MMLICLYLLFYVDYLYVCIVAFSMLHKFKKYIYSSKAIIVQFLQINFSVVLDGSYATSEGRL